MFDFLDKENLSISSILSPFNFLCKSDVSALIKKTSNFKRKVLKLVKENQNSSQFFSRSVPELNLEAEDNVNTLDSFGPYCNKVGLTKNSLQNYLSFSGDPLKFSNGSIIELNKYRASKYI